MTTKTTKTDLADRLADHEDRLRRLEVWVAGTTTTKQGGAAEYPLAVMVKPWADPEEVARLLASDDEEGLARLIYADRFVKKPDEAVGAEDHNERRYIGETDVILDDVNRAYDLAAVGLIDLHAAITRHIEAGCQVVVAARLVNALACAGDAFDDLGEAFAYLYSGPGVSPTADKTDDNPDPFF